MQIAGTVALFLQLPPYVLWPYAAGAAAALIAVFTTREAATQARGWDKLLALTPLFLAPPLAAFGGEHLTIARAISTMVPTCIPWHMFWAYFVGCALIAAGLSIASNVQMRLACTLLGLMFFVFVATMHIPGIVAKPKNLLTWALALRDLSFGAGAWALAGSLSAGSLNKEVRSQSAIVMINVGRFVIATAVLYFAVLHFLHPAVLPGVPDEKLTPVWMPGRLVAAYLTGAVLAVAGVCILLGIEGAESRDVSRSMDSSAGGADLCSDGDCHPIECRGRREAGRVELFLRYDALRGHGARPGQGNGCARKRRMKFRFSVVPL